MRLVGLLIVCIGVLCVPGEVVATGPCWVLIPKYCPGPFIPPPTTLTCTGVDCDVFLTGGEEPGDPPVEYYVCKEDVVTRDRGDRSHRDARGVRQGEVGGDQTPITGTTFVYCQDARSCSFDQPCAYMGKCSNNGTVLPYVNSKKFDLVYPQGTDECSGSPPPPGG